jgi:hypothetical protein
MVYSSGSSSTPGTQGKPLLQPGSKDRLGTYVLVEGCDPMARTRALEWTQSTVLDQVSSVFLR